MRNVRTRSYKLRITQYELLGPKNATPWFKRNVRISATAEPVYLEKITTHVKISMIDFMLGPVSTKKQKTLADKTFELGPYEITF